MSPLFEIPSQGQLVSGGRQLEGLKRRHLISYRSTSDLPHLTASWSSLACLRSPLSGPVQDTENVPHGVFAPRRSRYKSPSIANNESKTRSSCLSIRTSYLITPY